MKTIETKLTAANNAEYQKNSTNKYVEEYKKQTLEILQNPNTTFSEFIEIKAVEAKLSDKLQKKGFDVNVGGRLMETVSYLTKFNKGQQKIEKNEYVNNSITSAPNFKERYVLGQGKIAA